MNNTGPLGSGALRQAAGRSEIVSDPPAEGAQPRDVGGREREGLRTRFDAGLGHLAQGNVARRHEAARKPHRDAQHAAVGARPEHVRQLHGDTQSRRVGSLEIDPREFDHRGDRHLAATGKRQRDPRHGTATRPFRQACQAVI